YLGPWPWYIVALTLLAWVFFFAYYAPFLIIDLVGKRRGDSAIAANRTKEQLVRLMGHGR
ncbi:MAG: hypothetical protein V3T72_10975, partial [Thermoanaerobaculia bacterium]